jgi:expansin
MAKLTLALLALLASPALGSLCKPRLSRTGTGHSTPTVPVAHDIPTLSSASEAPSGPAPETQESEPAVEAAPTGTDVTADISAAAAGGAAALGEPVKGKSTFYGGNLEGGMCSFTGYTLPAGIFGTAFSGSAWGSGAHCGACVEVTGPSGNTLTAMVRRFVTS